MHILRPAFVIERDEAFGFASSRGFGLVVTHDGTRPVGSHLPFILRREGASAFVQCHVAQANPLAHLADGQRPFLVAVSGTDAYVSNDWYATPDQVSTWLYEAVHLTGNARCLPLPTNRRHGDDLLQEAERPLAPKPPWRLDEMDPAKRSAMLGAITTIEIAVEIVEGQRKLNQHKPDADHISVVRALEQSDRPASREVARRLRAIRPLLAYGEAHPDTLANASDGKDTEAQ